jgi:LysM repeat protein
MLAAIMAGCGRPTDTPLPTPAPLGVILPTSTSRATRLPGERTPPPTFTPAPTPTPVFHFVQPGETLIDISLKYGVTLDALQAANGVLTPETLQIGQQLVIPVASGAQPASGGGLLLPTPTPLPVTVHGTALYETPVGSVWVLGEVVNSVGTALENTQVRVALLDESGAEVAIGTAFTALDVIPVDGKSPFGVLFRSPPPGAASFVVTPIRAEASSEPGGRYMPIVIASQQSMLDGLQFRLTGSIANQGAFNATDVSAVLTTYDASGRVTGFRQASVGDGTLAAGGVAEFEISIAPNGPAGTLPVDYSLTAQGRTARP